MCHFCYKSSDLALEFIILSESKLRILGPMWCTVTMFKPPILGSNGVESQAEFHTMILQSFGESPWWPKGDAVTCTVDHLSNTWPFGNCVYGWIYYVVNYTKVDKKCDDESIQTHKVILG